MRFQSAIICAALAWASITSGSPIVQKNAAAIVERDLRSCNNNPALSALKVLKATKFCSEFLNFRTRTVVGESVEK